MIRRIALLLIVLFLGLRTYGDRIFGWLQSPDAQRDVIVTRYEFRPELGGEKPAWIVGLKNTSTRFTYEKVELQAAYLDSGGAVLEQDRILISQRLAPGEEQLVPSLDYKNRPGAVQGTLKISQGENTRK